MGEATEEETRGGHFRPRQVHHEGAFRSLRTLKGQEPRLPMEVYRVCSVLDIPEKLRGEQAPCRHAYDCTIQHRS